MISKESHLINIVIASLYGISIAIIYNQEVGFIAFLLMYFFFFVDEKLSIIYKEIKKQSKGGDE